MSQYARPPYLVWEQAVIGGMLSALPGRPSRIGEAIRRLTINDLGNGDAANVYTAILAIHRDGKEPDVDLVIMRCPEIPRDSLYRFLSECLQEAGACLHFSEKIGKVKQESCRRQIRELLAEATEAANENHCDASMIAAKIADKAKQLARDGQLEAFRVYDGPTLLGMRFQEIVWTVESLIPEGLTILAGPPKLGKSWLVLLIALAITSGTDALGCYRCTQGEVLYLALEDTPRRMQSRLSKIVNRRQITPAGLFIQHSAPPIGAGLENYLRGWLAEHPQTRLIIIDTLAKVRPPRKKGEDIYSADYQVVSAMKAVADEHQVAVVLVTHTRKMADPDPLAEVSGSMGITGSADTILVLKRDRGQASAVLHATGRDIDEAELAMTWSADAATWTVAGDAEELRRSKSRKELLDVFREAGRPIKLKTIYEALPGRKQSSLRSLVGDAMRAGDLLSLGEGLYTLNDGGPTFTTTTTTEPDILSPGCRAAERGGGGGGGGGESGCDQQGQRDQQGQHDQHDQQRD